MFKGVAIMDNIYLEIEKYIKSNFSGNESHQEIRIKILQIPKTIREKIRNSVNTDFSISQTIEWILRERKSIPISKCRCGKSVNGIFCSLIKGYRFQEYCSTKCRSQDEKFKNKIAQTNIERYGHASNMWGSDIRKKTKEKWVKKFGVDNPSKSNIIKEKIKNTNQQRWSINWPGESKEFRKKMIATCIARYGEDDKFLYSKAKETSRHRYNVDFPMQDPLIFSKTMKFKRKTGILPSGAEFSFQGYEDVAVKILLNEGLSENEIIISLPSLIPVIEYWNPVKGKMCHYFPDIWVPSKNLLIEVKSAYTMKKQIEENLAKQKAAKSLGFDHQIWVCSKDQLLEII